MGQNSTVPPQDLPAHTSLQQTQTMTASTTASSQSRCCNYFSLVNPRHESTVVLATCQNSIIRFTFFLRAQGGRRGHDSQAVTNRRHPDQEKAVESLFLLPDKPRPPACKRKHAVNQRQPQQTYALNKKHGHGYM